MFSCKEMTKMTSEEQNLGFFGGIQFRFHLVICKNCRCFAENMKSLNRSIKTLIKKKTKVDRQKIKKLENEIIEKFSSKE